MAPASTTVPASVIPASATPPSRGPASMSEPVENWIWACRVDAQDSGGWAAGSGGTTNWPPEPPAPEETIAPAAPPAKETPPPEELAPPVVPPPKAPPVPSPSSARTAPPQAALRRALRAMKRAAGLDVTMRPAAFSSPCGPPRTKTHTTQTHLGQGRGRPRRAGVHCSRATSQVEPTRDAPHDPIRAHVHRH